MLHAKFEEKPIKYGGDYSTRNIRDFITENALPSVTEMNHDNAQKLFKSPNDGKSHLLVFHNKSLDTFDDEFKMLSRVGRQFKDKVIFGLFFGAKQVYFLQLHQLSGSFPHNA